MNEDEVKILQEENKKLRKENGYKSEIISLLAHEIRTSLSAIKWMFKMLLDFDFGPLTMEQKTVIEKGELKVTSMISLVNRLLSKANQEDTELEFRIQKANIIDFLDEIVSEFKSETIKRKIELLYIKPQVGLILNIDAPLIKIVFQNIIDNALKYSKKNSKIIISTLTNEKEFIVSVSNEGIGISEADSEKIFTKYFRSKNAIATKDEGIGLGLFTSRKIIEKHGGKIWLATVDENRVVFNISLPLPRC